MSTKSLNDRIIFGLKVKQFRQGSGLSFADLSKVTGMSISYLNEIEKGKKYPKGEKVGVLANTLGVTEEELTSAHLDKNMAPLQELLNSNFLQELPLDLFGIELSKIVEIIANAPAKVGAFISTLLEISRSYAVKEENFYFGALRSYLELHNNYFQEIEDAVERFVKTFHLSNKRPLALADMERILTTQYGYTIQKNGLDAYPEFKGLRSLFIPKSKTLLLSGNLTPAQTLFVYGKEAGFQMMHLQERSYTSSVLKGRSFEEVHNHAKAIYFATALLMPLKDVLLDTAAFLNAPRFQPDLLQHLMSHYDASPEMVCHRLTNVLPKFFGLEKLFFLRFKEVAPSVYEIDRELHLTQKHRPHGTGLNEHYCRRWVSISILHDLAQGAPGNDSIVQVQRSRYLGSQDEYLCFSIARKDYPVVGKKVSVTIGILIDDQVKETISWWNDPAIPVKTVNNTCERCSLADCGERSAEPIVIQKRDQRRKVEYRLNELLN